MLRQLHSLPGGVTRSMQLQWLPSLQGAVASALLSLTLAVEWCASSTMSSCQSIFRRPSSLFGCDAVCTVAITTCLRGKPSAHVRVKQSSRASTVAITTCLRGKSNAHVRVKQFSRASTVAITTCLRGKPNAHVRVKQPSTFSC
jgi:hypothetical protein